MHFSDEFWKKRFGVKIFDLASLLPTVGIREVCLDIYWAAFKHSHVFRNMDVSFLAVVATHMRYDFCLPGDVIFRQNELKSKMIYIVSGVIQVISEVDGETPIISFSTGTLLGESTLFFSYMNKTDVICSTFCEIMVLERRPFHDILSYYPFQRWYFYRNMKVNTVKPNGGGWVKSLVVHKFKKYGVNNKYIN
ncbi:hypothetical protein C0J52_04267 [Blattella germanica]|nr:hypothetical protein C0J52_04267 [Blattella germanica]